MEIQFKRTYTSGLKKGYALGEISGMLGYAMEIVDPRTRMQSGKLLPGQICMLIFAITPEEYALKDQDVKALNTLAEKLTKYVPADRLLGWRIVDLKGAQLKSDLIPQAGESIDGGEFARRMQAASAGPVDALLLQAAKLQKVCAAKDAPAGVREDYLQARRALAEALLGQDTLYLLYDVPTGERWPSVGFDGRMELFTTQQRAERALKQFAAAQNGLNLWKIHTLQGEAIRKTLLACAADGLDLIRVDNGFAAAEVNAADFGADASHENARLRGWMIREVEYGLRWNQLKDAHAPEALIRGALESMLTMRNFAWREAGNATLYALCPNGMRDKCLLVGSSNQPQKHLAVFTNADRARHFAHAMKAAALPLPMCFDELAARGENSAGMLVDVSFIGYRIPTESFAQVRELRAKPPVAVRIRPEGGEAPAPQPAPVRLDDENLGSLPDPDVFAPASSAQSSAPVRPQDDPVSLGSLPDPDAFAPAAPAQTPAPQPEQTPAEPLPRAKKSLFQKIFRK